MDPILNRIEERVKSDFEKNNRLLSFDEYLGIVAANPRTHLRGSAQYLVDVIDSFGVNETPNGPRFKIFDMEFSDRKFRVVGQNSTHLEIYRSLKNFVKEGINNKLILLHGPNGSAKSSTVQCLMKGMEHYSEKPEGALYRFNWVFPIDKYIKQGLGLTGGSPSKASMASFAKLPEEDIAARVPCDLKDHPLLLIPAADRNGYLENLAEKGDFSRSTSDSKYSQFTLPDYLTKGSLCHKCNQIYEALLLRYKGDLSKVLAHIQVERFFINKRYRNSAVTIEPQMHVDAQSRQVTADRSLAFLPPSLQYISLYELLGDLPDGNRGIIDFADLLKRPVDTFKYLLIACEQGSVNVGSSIAFLDSVLIGSTNELQLDAFKEFPDFVSFKARIELVRVPYILEYTEEQKIYDIQIQKIAGEKHVTPHTTTVAALWAVLTRLKKPNASHYPAALTEIIGNMTPLEKAKLYDHGEMAPNLSADQRKFLKAAIPKLREEYNSVPYYEGRMGASAREIKGILYDAAQSAEFRCLTPLSIFRELDDFVKRVTEYEFLKQDVRDGYHDSQEFINVVRLEYLNTIDQEVRESMGLFEKVQYEDYLKKYIIHLSHLIKGEKMKNAITGKLESPDEQLLDEFEGIIGAPRSGKERDAFRQNVISTIGAYSLDHPNEVVKYRNVFPDFMARLEDHYFDQQKSQMTAMHDAIALFGSEREADHEASKLAKLTLSNLVKKFGYCEHCAKSTVMFLIKAKY